MTNAYAGMNKRFCFLNPHEDIVTVTAAMHNTTAVEFYKDHLEPDLVEEWTQCRAFFERIAWKSKLRYHRVCNRINLGLVVATNHEQIRHAVRFEHCSQNLFDFASVQLYWWAVAVLFHSHEKDLELLAFYHVAIESGCQP